MENTKIPLIVKNTYSNTSYLIDTDGTVMLYDEKAVARIKETLYETLQAAIDAVPTDNKEREIILLEDVSENVNIPKNNNIILNLNNNTISSQSQVTIKAYGTLVLMNGTVKSTEKNAFYNYGNTIIKGNNTILSSESSSKATISNASGAKLIINDGLIESKNCTTIFNHKNGEVIIDGFNVRINNKSASNEAIGNDGSVIIKKGLIYSENGYALRNSSASITFKIGNEDLVSNSSPCFIVDSKDYAFYKQGGTIEFYSGIIKSKFDVDQNSNITSLKSGYTMTRVDKRDTSGYYESYLQATN